MHTEGKDPMYPEGQQKFPSRDRDDNNPGYETQDVNVTGLMTFLAGLVGFLVIFFVFCFVMGKAINTGIMKEDGKRDKWHQDVSMPTQELHHKRENLVSSAAMEQRQFAAMTQQFPTPRLQTDDGNQDTADMHAREDLLLDNYSTGSGLPAGAVRIPIDRAMQLIVQRGLPQPAGGMETPGTEMAGDAHPAVTEPLTDGFARTGYELDQIAAREQRLDFNRAEAKR